MQHIRRRAGELLSEKLIISPIHKIAAFLSPHFKTLKMLSPDESLAVQVEARILTTALIPNLQVQSAQSTSQAADGTSATEREEVEENLLKKRRMFQEWEDTPDLIEADEIQRYMLSHLSLEDCTEDVLGFWRDHVTISLSSRCWQERCFAFLQPGHQASALSVQQVACWKRVAIG
ncbi:unnamed protein product [Gadus morhua 'NCC']